MLVMLVQEMLILSKTFMAITVLPLDGRMYLTQIRKLLSEI